MCAPFRGRSCLRTDSTGQRVRPTFATARNRNGWNRSKNSGPNRPIRIAVVAIERISEGLLIKKAAKSLATRRSVNACAGRTLHALPALKSSAQFLVRDGRPLAAQRTWRWFKLSHGVAFCRTHVARTPATPPESWRPVTPACEPALLSNTTRTRFRDHFDTARWRSTAASENCEAWRQNGDKQFSDCVTACDRGRFSLSRSSPSSAQRKFCGLSYSSRGSF